MESSLFGIPSQTLYAYDMIRRDNDENYCLRLFDHQGRHIGYHRFSNGELSRLADNSNPRDGYYTNHAGIAFLRGRFFRADIPNRDLSQTPYYHLRKYLPHDHVTHVLMCIGSDKFPMFCKWLHKTSIILQYGGLPLVGLLKITKNNMTKLPIKRPLKLLVVNEKTAAMVRAVRSDIDIETVK